MHYKEEEGWEDEEEEDYDPWGDDESVVWSELTHNHLRKRGEK